jgi:prepilin-type processing-associated H-X9-DG protein
MIYLNMRRDHDLLRRTYLLQWPEGHSLRKEQIMKKAFTFFEILATLAMVTILVVIIFSTFAAARTRANSTQCSTQMNQIGQAMQLYAADYDGHMPPITTGEFTGNHGVSTMKWREMLQVYIQKPAFPVCPTAQISVSMQAHENSPNVSGYAYNGWLNKDVKIRIPGERQSLHFEGVSDEVINFSALTVTVIEARAGIVARRSPDVGKKLYGIWASDFTDEIAALPEGARRHSGGANYLFADGHVKWFRPENIGSNRNCDGIHPGFGL